MDLSAFQEPGLGDLWEDAQGFHNFVMGEGWGVVEASYVVSRLARNYGPRRDTWD